jgi:hypothetical protein
MLDEWDIHHQRVEEVRRLYRYEKDETAIELAKSNLKEPDITIHVALYNCMYIMAASNWEDGHVVSPALLGLFANNHLRLSGKELSIIGGSRTFNAEPTKTKAS